MTIAQSATYQIARQEAARMAHVLSSRAMEPQPKKIDVQDIQADPKQVENQLVETIGIVTKIQDNGFIIEQPHRKSKSQASSAIFVAYSGKDPGTDDFEKPNLIIGQKVKITGVVTDKAYSVSDVDVADDSHASNVWSRSIRQVEPFNESQLLPETKITIDLSKEDACEIQDKGKIYKLSTPIHVGTKGHEVPTDLRQVIDFYSNREYMRLFIDHAVVAGPVNKYGQISILVDPNNKDTRRTSDGGVLVEEDRKNYPRLIHLKVPASLNNLVAHLKVGDKLKDIVGHIDYNSYQGIYELVVTEEFHSKPGNFKAEKTNLKAGVNQVTTATVNTENFDINEEDGDEDIASGKLERLASHIGVNLNSPTVVCLQEIQDNDGSKKSRIVDSKKTLDALIAEIYKKSGVKYAAIWENPKNGEDGGQPGGNIRNVILYDPRFVEKTARKTERLDPLDPDDPEQKKRVFDNSRKPLVVEFKHKHNGELFTVINAHLTSKQGSSPQMGTTIPPTNGGEDKRVKQAKALLDYVIQLKQQGRRVMLAGDFNEMLFNEPLKLLVKEHLINLLEKIPEKDRYTYIFQGQSQAIDNFIVLKEMADAFEIDIVNLNSGVPLAERSSDHDFIVTRWTLGSSKKLTQPTRNLWMNFGLGIKKWADTINVWTAGL